MPSRMRCGRLPSTADQVTSDQFKTGLAELRTEMAGQRAELTGQIAELTGQIAEQRAEGAEVRTEIANLDTRLSTQIAEVRTEIGALDTRLSIQIAGVRTEIASLETRLIAGRRHRDRDRRADLRDPSFPRIGRRTSRPLFLGVRGHGAGSSASTPPTAACPATGGTWPVLSKVPERRRFDVVILRCRGRYPPWQTRRRGRG